MSSSFPDESGITVTTGEDCLLSLSNTDTSATVSVSPWLTVYESLTASGVITADGSSAKSWLYVRSPTVALNVQPALVYEDPA